MPFELRPYQSRAASAGIEHLTSVSPRGGGLIVAPTGSGKSLVIAEIARRMEGGCLVFQPSRDILKQNIEKAESYGLSPSVFSASFNRKEIGHLTFATIGSVIKHPQLFQRFKRFLVDECHLVNAKSGMYKKFFEMMPRDSRIVGLTASPFRLATNRLGSELRFLTRTRPRIFSTLIDHTQIGDLYDQGHLSSLRYREALSIDHRKLVVNTSGSDYTDRSVARHYDEVGFSDRLIRETRRQIEFGRTPLVFTRFIKEAEGLAGEIEGMEVVSSKTSPGERDRIVEGFKAGTVGSVANVGVLVRGFDHPALDCVVLGAATMSLERYYQKVGRCLRPHRSKPFSVVVDLVGLVKRFGKIEDMELRAGGKMGKSWAF